MRTKASIVLDNMKKAIRKQRRFVSCQILRELKVHDGRGWVWNVKLEATPIGIPSYFLQISQEGSTKNVIDWGIEAEDIRNLARFFTWLEKHSHAKKKALVSKFMKIQNQLWSHKAGQEN